VNIEIPSLTFTLAQTKEFFDWQKKWYEANLARQTPPPEPGQRYEVMIKFGIYELATVPVFSTTEELSSSEQEEVIADAIAPYIKKLFGGAPPWS
jgi:hypothetical protein